MPQDLPGEVLPQAPRAKVVSTGRPLMPCARCGAMRTSNLTGWVHGRITRLCAPCKASPYAKGKPPLFLSRAYREAAGVAA